MTHLKYEEPAIHRGSYRSVRDLTRAIRTYIDGWNARAHPITWTKPAEQILAKAKRPDSSNTGPLALTRTVSSTNSTTQRDVTSQSRQRHHASHCKGHIRCGRPSAHHQQTDPTSLTVSTDPD